jgi:hypothetical protein
MQVLYHLPQMFMMSWYGENGDQWFWKNWETGFSGGTFAPSQ